jgi:hypothetical protein
MGRRKGEERIGKLIRTSGVLSFRIFLVGEDGARDEGVEEGGEEEIEGITRMVEEPPEENRPPPEDLFAFFARIACGDEGAGAPLSDGGRCC